MKGYGLKDERMVLVVKFSREFGGLQDGKSCFEGFKPLNSLENSQLCRLLTGNKSLIFIGFGYSKRV